MLHIDDDQRRHRLAIRHLLVPEARTDDLAAITDGLVALHSTDPATVYLSAFARMADASVGKVSRSLYDERAVVRHHAMRRTIWVMTPEVARLAHGAATAKIANAERRRTVKAFEDTVEEIDDGLTWLERATDEIAALLVDQGPLTTREIGRRLPHLSVPVVLGAGSRNTATVNAHTKVCQGAGFDGRFVRGAPAGDWRSAEYVWSPVEAWLDEPLAGRDEASAAEDLLARWLLRFGPATTTDIRWYFGWTATLTRAALQATEAVEVRLDSGENGWVAPGDEAVVDDPGPWLALLPSLDPTTMGWKQRDWYLAAERAPWFFDRWSNAGPTVWVDGRVVGTWIQGPDGRVRVELDGGPDRRHGRLLAEAVDRLEAAVEGAQVKPRFPSPASKALLSPD